jgi:hypothetical protein
LYETTRKIVFHAVWGIRETPNGLEKVHKGPQVVCSNV